ncbi:MAG: NAD(P)/FAD-dependent oxidoreductase [Candidatus Kapaibacterium sp.]
MYDCIIIGAGPAGVSSAIYLKRAGFNILVVEKKEVGGLVKNAFRIENYLTYKSITGYKIAVLIKKQLSYNKVNVVIDEINEVAYNKSYVLKSDNNCYYTKCVLIATGTKPKMLDSQLFSSSSVIDKIYYHITDIPDNCREKHIAVIGSGDVAFDYALSLKELGNNVVILARNKPKCIEILHRKVLENNIGIEENCGVKKISNIKDKLLLYTKDKEFKVDYLLVAIGRERNMISLESFDPKSCFPIGDLSNIDYRQISIATGDALKKSMEVEKYLINLKG